MALPFAGLIKLRELVRSPSQRDIEIHLRQADPDSYRSVLKEIKSKEIHNLVVDTRPQHMHHFLRGVSNLGLYVETLVIQIKKHFQINKCLYKRYLLSKHVGDNNKEPRTLTIVINMVIVCNILLSFTLNICYKYIYLVKFSTAYCHVC